MTMKRFSSVLLAALVLAATLPPHPVRAQQITPFPWKSLLPAAGSLTADDTDAAFIIKYVGTAANGTVAVTSGDVVLAHGAVSAEAADATITGCGATAGTLDVDNAACNTLGELVDKINTSANWRAVILDGLRSDTTSGATLVTLSAVSAGASDGVLVKWDTSVAFKASFAANAPRKMGAYLSTGAGRIGATLMPNVFQGKQCIIFHVNATSTYGSGTSAVTVTSVTPTNKSGGALGTEVVQTVFSKAGGASTVNAVVIDSVAASGVGVLTNRDSKCLVRIVNSAAASAVLLNVYGVGFSY
jgi:hypothetical protein